MNSTLPLLIADEIGGVPVGLRDTAGGESQNAVQKNKCIRCYPTLVLHYICRISEAVRHSQAENVIFVCLCSHLLLSLFIKFHCMEGLVTKNTGSWYIVRTENGDSIRCKIKGNFRLKGIRSTNPVSVGDLVDIELNPDQTAFITRIHERKNYIIRRSSNLSKESHIIAANIDHALLIVTVNTPPTSTTFIDRFLATAEAYRIPVCIVINKSDTFTEEDREYAEALRYLYTSIGYDCHCVSAITGEGFDFIDSFIANKITLLSGHSGVGKSTIIDRILPNAHVKIGAVSTSHHKGMHTTTFSEMYPLPQGGYIIDTPGIKGFGTIDFNPNEVAHFFPEIFEISQNCRFNNCTHRHEPGCAVLKALENHQISESRYTSYLSIIEDSSEGKYREAF